MLVLEKSSDGKSNASLLVRPKDATRELWDGPRCGVDKAADMFGFPKKSYSIEDLPKMDFLNAGYSILYYDDSANSEMSAKLMDARRANPDLKFPNDFRHSSTILNSLKMLKSENEINIIRKTCEISSHAFISAMKSTKPGMSELHIEAILEFESRLRGAQRLAYPPVCAAGNNGNSMHYVQNTQLLKDGDLLLVDAAAEYHMYPCDITRTWPVSGKFSPEQKLVYEAVLDIQKKCIEKCKVGATFTAIQEFTQDLVRTHLIDLGICNRLNISTVR